MRQETDSIIIASTFTSNGPNKIIIHGAVQTTTIFRAAVSFAQHHPGSADKHDQRSGAECLRVGG